jgi:hypothetical protein
MIRAAFRAERRRHAHARASIGTSVPRTKVQEWSLSFDAAGCVIAATSRDACSASCWRSCGRLIAGRLSTLPVGEGRWRGRGDAFTPCRCVTLTGTRARVTAAAPREAAGPESSWTPACEAGRASATAPAADGSTPALTGAAPGADAASELATLSAAALLAVTVVVAATTGSAAGASAAEAAPATAETAGASGAVAGGARVRDGKTIIGSTYPCWSLVVRRPK